jgi:hydroxymethylpyrimidine/phosphomethylpyrimidine kinase
LSETGLPTCLVFSGHDPTGGAGIQADIETLSSMRVHAATLITALTVQDTANAYTVEPVSASLLLHQARVLRDDLKPAAVKVGLVPDIATVKAIHTIISELDGVPIVLDPIVRAGGGRHLQEEEARYEMLSLLFPLATVITPNQDEARAFASNADTPEACAMSMLESGCDYVLMTGGDADGQKVSNRLYGNNRCLETFSWPRLHQQYHGSGCTLASAIAGLLSHGHEPLSAVREAQQYTWNCLDNAYETGTGQLNPDRFFWTGTKS